MTDDTVQQIVSKAVQQAYEDWAAEHPGLAGVIDGIVLTQRTVESLRDSEQYRDAMEEYQQARIESNLFNRILTLAGPILQTILAG